MIKTIGKKFGRAIHYDFHTSPGVDGILGNFDADVFADQLANAHVDYVNVAARCNMGFSYYNTKIGVKYPGLGDRDPLREMIDACHKRNIGVTAYINVGLNHAIAANNYGWLKISKDGKVYRDDKKNNFFRVMCYNSDYRQYFLNEVKEICEYDIDGIFIDCFSLRECFCPRCMADMARRGVDMEDSWAPTAYQNDVRIEFAEEMKEALGEKRGKIKFYVNGMSWSIDCQTHAEVECLTPEPMWGYDYFNATAAYTRTIFEDRVYMSGRFQNSWGDFGGVKPIASMQNDLYDAMMNSFGISYGDHLHPVDGFEDEVADRIGKVMAERIAYEPYINDSDNVVEIGLLKKAADYKIGIAPFEKGAARMLKELKLQYNIYDENGDFDGVGLLVVAEHAKFDGKLKERLKNYVKNGGKIIFTGEAVDLGKECELLEYAEVVGKDERDNSYYTVDGSNMRWATYNTARVIKNISGKEIARDINNVVNFTWDGTQSCYYRPQGEPTGYSAAIVSDNTACISFDIFDAYAENFLVEHRELFKRLVDELLPEKLIESPNMPKTATAAITKNASHTVFHVKSTYPEHKMVRGIVEEHIYMKSVEVSLKGEYEVYVLPEMTKLESRRNNGRTVFETGDFLGYRAFLLK